MSRFIPFFLLPLFSITTLFAEEEAPASSREGNIWQMVIMIVIALAFFYLILLRPEQKRRKKMEKQRAALRKGDQVVAMGILGNISQIKDDSILIQTGEAKIEVLKGSISEVRSASQSESQLKGQ